MRFIVFFLLSYSLVFSTTAQDGDWVVTIKQDTLYGKLSFIINDAYRMDQVVLKIGKEKQKYEPIELFRIFKKDKEYVPIKIDGKYQFAKIVSENYLSWYKYVNPESNAYEDFGLDLLVKKNGTSLKISNLGFKKGLSNFLDDCTSLVQLMDSQKFNARDLPEIIELYNECMDLKSTSVVEVEADLSQLAIISKLMEGVDRDKSLNQNTELIEMLKDVKGKLREGKDIPGYLKGAILEALADSAELTAQFNSLF